MCVCVCTHRYTPRPWSRTCRNRSGRADPAAATSQTDWRTTRRATRCWPSKTRNPGRPRPPGPSRSRSERWTATTQPHKTTSAVSFSVYYNKSVTEVAKVSRRSTESSSHFYWETNRTSQVFLWEFVLVQIIKLYTKMTLIILFWSGNLCPFRFIPASE